MRRKRSRAFDDNEDLNPMNYLSNLSDVMLVLAVGMMLALVVAWNVDIINTSPDNKTPDEAQAVSEMNPAEFTPDENEQTLDENELREYGTVYVDKDGNYYVVEGGNGE